MANFNNLALTAEGVKALLAAQAGTTLTLSKIGLGSGSTTSSSVNLKSLVAPELMMPISTKKIDSTSGHITLVAKMTNEGIADGFYWRETGLFFEDSEGNDVLFAYSCTTSEYDYIPAYSDQRYVKHIRIANIITDSADITIKENEGLLYVDTLTYEDFKNEMEEHVSDTNNPHGVTPEKIGALNVVMKNNSVFKTLYGDHEYINKEIDDSIPVIPVTSNFLHILNIGPSGNVLAVISLPTDYSTTVYRYSRSDGEWIRLISQKDIVDNLLSTRSDLPVSAKQANVLSEQISLLNTKISNVDEMSMLRRGNLTSASVLSETQRGIYYCNADYPNWLPCGWCYAFLPNNGNCNGAFVIAFASGSSAGHYTYSNRYNKWINHDETEELSSKIKNQLSAATIWADSKLYVQFRLTGGLNRCMIGLFDSGSLVSFYPINWDNVSVGSLSALSEIKVGSASQGVNVIKESDGTKRIKLLPNENIGRTITLVAFDVYTTIVESWTSTT